MYCDKKVCKIIKNNLNEVELDKLKDIFFTYLTDIIDDADDGICISDIIGYMIRYKNSYIKKTFKNNLIKLINKNLFQEYQFNK